MCLLHISFSVSSIKAVLTIYVYTYKMSLLMSPGMSMHASGKMNFDTPKSQRIFAQEVEEKKKKEKISC